MMLRYISVCSGIEAASAAWKPYGFEPAAFAEIDPFLCAVLKYQFPDVPNLGDFTRTDSSQLKGKADILVGGTPCQAFSIAGQRKGLDDDCGTLTMKFAELADAIRPEIVVWENVPGVLSMRDNVFGHFAGALSGNEGPLVPAGGKWTNAGAVAGSKRKIAWRILDAQYFGVAQRRKRVFLIAVPASSRVNPWEILFECEGMSGYFEQSGKAQNSIAKNSEASPYCWFNDPAPAILAHYSKGISMPSEAKSLIVFAKSYSHTLNIGSICPPVMASAGSGGNNTPMILKNSESRVRRLTPLECERLQGFPDNWTNIPWKGKENAPDSLRYKAIGNSMCVNVMRWIGKRIIRNIH